MLTLIDFVMLLELTEAIKEIYLSDKNNR